MKRNKGMQLSAVLAVMLIVSMAFVPMAGAAENDAKSIASEKNDGSCTSCNNNYVCKGVVGDPKELSGAEKDKGIDKALKDNGVKEIQKQLKKEGFILNDIEAYTVPLETEYGLRVDALLVAIPYKKDKSEEGKTIIYAHNPQKKESTVVLIDGTVGIQGFTTCAFNLLACIGTATVCTAACSLLLLPEPAEPAEIVACLGCLPLTVGVCGLAYCECTEYFCDLGHQWSCDNQCT